MSTPRSLSLDAGVERATISTPRGEFAALVAQPEDPVATVVFVPGFTGGKEDFLHILSPLAKAGFRALAYDQRGQYQSAAAAEGEHITLDLLAGDLVALIDTVSDDSRAHVVGHSFGGLVAQTAAINQGQALQSLVLMCTGPGALPPSAHDLLNSLIHAISSGMSLNDVWLIKDQLERAGGSPPPPPEVHEFLRVRFTSNHPAALAHKAHILTASPDRTAELAQALHANGIAGLVLYGEGDDAWDIEDQNQMAAGLNVEVVVIEHAEHSPAVENVAATTHALVDFWREKQHSPELGV